MCVFKTAKSQLYCGKTRNGTRPPSPFLENTRSLLPADALRTEEEKEAESWGGYKRPSSAAFFPPFTHFPIRHIPPATVLCGFRSSGSNNDANTGAVKLTTGWVDRTLRRQPPASAVIPDREHTGSRHYTVNGVRVRPLTFKLNAETRLHPSCGGGRRPSGYCGILWKLHSFVMSVSTQ